MAGVAVGGPGLVAVGWDESGGDPDAAVWTSSDGITWSRIPHDESIFGGEDDQAMSAVTVGGPGLVAVGWDESGGDADAAVWTSSDGITWSRVSHDETALGGDNEQFMNAVTAGGPGLVAVGTDGFDTDPDAAVWTSSDGITWSRVPHDEAIFGGQRNQSMDGVATGGPGVVAVGTDGSGDDGDAVVWTSSDGITWSRVSDGAGVLGGDGRQLMLGVTAGGPGLVAVGSEGNFSLSDAAVWASSDGINWSRAPHDDAVFGGRLSQAMVSVTAGGPGLVAVGWDGVLAEFRIRHAAVWSSPDGLSWSRTPDDETLFGDAGDQPMLDITTLGPMLVAVGHESPGRNLGAAAWTGMDGG